MKVTLSNGIEVNLRTPATWKAWGMAECRYPEVQPPVTTSTTVTGQEISMSIDDDPGYLLAVKEREKKVNSTASELIMLLALKDVKVPDGWTPDVYADEFMYVNPDWKPREGAVGVKLDYIEYELLAAPKDFALVQSFINESTDVDQDEVDSIVKSFQS